MGNSSKSKSRTFQETLEQYKKERIIPEKTLAIVQDFFDGYAQTLSGIGIPREQLDERFTIFLEHVQKQCKEPFIFQPFHAAIKTPFNYYQFGVDFFKPLIDVKHSTIHGKETLHTIMSSLRRGENAIFLANHQSEADPQAMSVLLDEEFPQFAEQLIFVAGERVITDPLAVPLSMGRNLLCIYSKRYIDFPPELKVKKQHHNRRTMELMSELLSEGGKAIYVAPSGGRDRANPQGIFEVAPFDAQSIEMFSLMAERAASRTFFYPLALKTHALLPPPETIQVELGEWRKASRSALALAFGPQIDMDRFPGYETKDKRQRREARAQYIWSLVKKLYRGL